MRRIPTISVCVLAISVCLLLAFYSSVRSEETGNASSHIQELQQKRLALLQQIEEIAMKRFQNARVEYMEVLAGERELLVARIEYAQTREERIKACDQAIQKADECQELIEALRTSARALPTDLYRAQAFVLEAQIAREKAATGS
jgi:non-homologous end joining protein Ku